MRKTIISTIASLALSPGGQPAACDAGDRIEPPQAGEPEEIRVGGVEDGIVLDGERGDLRVRHEIARRAERLQQPKDLFNLAEEGFQNPRDGLSQPGANMCRRFRGSHRRLKYAGVRRDADETEYHHRRQADRLVPRQTLLPPRRRFLVKGGVGVVRVDQEVDIGDNHPPFFAARFPGFFRKPSASRSSASLLKRAGSTPARNPRERALITNGTPATGAGLSPRPARKPAFSVSLNDFRERCMASRNIRSTSVSRVTVVLMETS